MAEHRTDPTRTPLLLTPELVYRPWGGRRLAHLGERREETSGPVGEAWLAGPGSRVLGPESAGGRGAALADLAREHGEAFVGSGPFARYGARVPLLTKLLDVAAPLSVQVHPDDAYALRFEAASGHLGKTEAWYVLDAAPGAFVLWGWEREVSAEEVRAAVSAGTLEELLHVREVRPGDVVVNEAGVVHAVGPGVLIFELQQASDLTYRLYDYENRDASGEPRELHVDKALEVARLAPSLLGEPPVTVGPGRVRLASTAAFTLERWEVGRGGAPSTQGWHVDPRSLEFWTVIEGEARLECEVCALDLRCYQSVALPASLAEASWCGEALLLRGRA